MCITNTFQRDLQLDKAWMVSMAIRFTQLPCGVSHLAIWVWSSGSHHFSVFYLWCDVMLGTWGFQSYGWHVMDEMRVSLEYQHFASLHSPQCAPLPSPYMLYLQHSWHCSAAGFVAGYTTFSWLCFGHGPSFWLLGLHAFSEVCKLCRLILLSSKKVFYKEAVKECNHWVCS